MQPIAEPRETLFVQQKQLISGNRRVQMFPRGEGMLPLPKGMASIRVKNGDKFHFNPKKIKVSEIVAASRAGRENELLDLGPLTKNEAMQRAAKGERPLAVVERTPAGIEARAAAGTDRTASAQLTAMQRTKSRENRVGIEPAEHTIAQRLHRADGGAVHFAGGGSAPSGGWAEPDDPDDWTLPDAPPFDPSQPFEVLTDDPRSSLRSVLHQVPTGFNEALASGAGAPVDAATWGLNKIPGVDIKKPFMGSDFIKQNVLGAVGINPDDRPARTPGERIARGAGEASAFMIAPEAIVGALRNAGALTPRVLEALQSVFGSARTAPSVLANAGIGAVAGGAGTSAAEMAPDEYKSIAAMGGNLAGGALGVGAVAAGRGAGTLMRGTREYLAPITEAGQQRTAARTIADQATSPRATLDTLEHTPRDLVPGSEPTTFQATGDMGLGALEREVATHNPAEFMQRRGEQNAARTVAMQNLQPSGSPSDVANVVRQQLRDIDGLTDQALAGVTTEAQARAAALGGHGSPEEYGASIRSALADARAAAKGRERGLWQAVDPDGTLALPASSIRTAAEQIEAGLTHSARPMTGEERAIFDTVSRYDHIMPFADVTDARSRISTAMREELRSAGETPTYARLARLRGAVEGAIANAVEHRTAQEAQAVARGDLASEQTIAALLRRQVDDWRATIPSFGGAEGQGRGRSSNAPRDSRLQGIELKANFDEAARDRLNAATTATRERKQTFDAGPIGGVLRSAGMQGQYRTLDAAVPEAIFRRGPAGHQTVESFRRAVGDDAAMSVLADHAAASLRRVAMKPDGTLDPNRLAMWRRNHSEALRAFPELDSRFSEAAGSSRAIEDIAAVRRDALDHYQQGAIGQILKANSAEDVTRVVGDIFGQKNSGLAMRQLVGETRRNPAAHEGLRKAVVDHITDRFISNTEAATTGQGLIRSDAFQKFVRENGPALKQVFSEQGVNFLRVVAADLHRANRSIAAVKLPGGSNTAQDQAAQQVSLLRQFLHHAIGAAAGAGAGAASPIPFGSLAGAIGGAAVSAMRQAGMKKVDDLVKAAMLDPGLAKTLLMRAPIKPDRGSALTLGHYLRRTATQSLFSTPLPVREDDGWAAFPTASARR